MAAIAATVVSTGLLAVPAVAMADDFDNCTATVSLATPARVAVSHQNTQFILATEYANQPCVRYVSFDFVRTQDGVRHSDVTVDGSETTSLFTLGDGDGPGTYLMTNGTITDGNGDKHPTTDAGSLDVRYNGRVSVPRVIRSHGKVTLTATTTRYNIHDYQYTDSVVGYVKWGHAAVSFQKQTGATWTTVKTVSTSGLGVATAKLATGKAKWRAVVADAAVAWGATSGSVTR